MTYMRNAWYVVALDTEIVGTATLSRRVLDDALLIYRKADGTPVVMRDRCPHRFAPLSMGKRIGDDVVCGYHALRFDCSGKCVHSQHGDGRIPKAAAVRTYPAISRYGFIWSWMGEQHEADLDLLPDYSLLEGGHENSKGYAYLRMEANYEIIVDNIMDLSHVDVVHGPLLSTAGKLSPMTPRVQDFDRSVSVRWEWQQQPPMGLFAPFLSSQVDEAEQHVEVVWTAPASMLLTVGAVQGSRRYEEGLITWDHHLMTPETATSTHYFFGSRRNWLVDNAELNRMKLDGTIAAFVEEDKPIIEAVQREMGTNDLWSLNPVLLSSDPGAVRARRKLAGLIALEQKPAAEVIA